MHSNDPLPSPGAHVPGFSVIRHARALIARPMGA
jgi:hypothetical protein